MTISPLWKPLGIVAAILSLVQGLTWSILSILAILIYTKAWTPSSSKITYGQLLSNEIVTRYLIDNPLSNVLKVNLLMEPQNVFVWAIVYLILSVLWVTIAAIVIWVIFKEIVHLIKNLYLAIGICISVVCVCDLILTILFAIDYNTITAKVNSIPLGFSIHFMQILACGIVMTLAAKGFILWIINLVFAIITIKLAIDMPNQVTKDDLEHIDAFGTSHTKYENNTFGIFHGLPRLPPIQSTNERLTNLNKITTNSEHYAPGEYDNSAYLYSLQNDESDFDPEFDTASIENGRNPPLKSALRNRY